MKRDFILFIEDIFDNINLIESSMKGISKSLFKADADKKDATMRRLEIIGEAVKNLPESFRMKYPRVPWRDIAGFRDVVVHAYFGVDMERVWGIIRKDMPVLRKQIESILKKEKEDSSG